MKARQIWSKLISASWLWSPIDMVVHRRRVHIRKIQVCVRIVHCFGCKRVCAHVSWIASENGSVQTFLIRFSRICAWFLLPVFEYPRSPTHGKSTWIIGVNFDIQYYGGIRFTRARIRISPLLIDRNDQWWSGQFRTRRAISYFRKRSKTFLQI